MMEWLSIEKLAPSHRISHNEIVIGKFYQPTNEGEPFGAMELAWAHVAYPTASGWRVGTGGFVGVHGFASFPLSEATHWMPLPTPPVQS